MNHGLFQVDVLAGLHGIYGGALMPMVGGGDEDGIDVFARKDFAVVAGGKKIRTPQLFGVREAAVIAVCDGDQLDAGNL